MLSDFRAFVEPFLVGFSIHLFYDKGTFNSHRSRQIKQGNYMSDQDLTELRLSHARLKTEHADFDAAINAMMATGCNPLQIQRMKKKKLALKDKLTQLEDQILPDIIA